MKGAEQDMEPKKSGDGDQGKQRSWWDYVAGASGLLAVLGAMTYVLGMFALWVPVTRTYTHSFYTAWHAASLVPRNVVAGLGVERIVAWPLVGVVLTVTLILVVHGISKRIPPKVTPAGLDNASGLDDATRRTRVLYLLSLNFYVVAPIVFFFTGRQIATSLAAFHEISALELAFLLSFEAYLIGFPLIYVHLTRVSETRGTEEKSNMRARVVRRIILLEVAGIIIGSLAIYSYGVIFIGSGSLVWFQALSGVDAGTWFDVAIFVLSAVAALVGANFAVISLYIWSQEKPDYMKAFVHVLTSVGATFAIAFMLSTTRDPPMPKVTITHEGQDTRGDFLAHTEGFWYVFNERDELVAIPDDAVKRVRIPLKQQGSFEQGP